MAIRVAFDKDSLEDAQYFLLSGTVSLPYQFDAGEGMTLWVQLDMPAGDSTVYYWTQQGE
jgi:hypothetical protein